MTNNHEAEPKKKKPLTAFELMYTCFIWGMIAGLLLGLWLASPYIDMERLINDRQPQLRDKLWHAIDQDKNKTQ